MPKLASFINAPKNHGPFDVIGDVHGCANELETLLQKLGWYKDAEGVYTHDDARRMVAFVGDLVDRGPDNPRVLQMAMDLLEKKRAYWVMGNHDDRLRRYLKGNKVKTAHGLQETIDQLAAYPAEFSQKILETLENLPSYAVLDNKKLIIAHAGLKEKYHFQTSESARRFALMGQSTGLFDEAGFPIRYDWAQDYRGTPTVIYGHVIVDAVEIINNCIDIDTGCVFGGKLTAYCWPSGHIVQVPSQTKWIP